MANQDTNKVLIFQKAFRKESDPVDSTQTSGLQSR